MKSLLHAFLVLIVLTVLTGLIYPAIVTAIAVVCFPAQAHGSLTYNKGYVTGSRLIGQNFADRKNFWPRPSATNFSAMPSGGSNLNPISSSLRIAVDARRDTFRVANGLSAVDTIPGDMLFASGSGLDPDISPEAARLQINRIARERNFTNDQKAALVSLVKSSIVPRQLGFLGSERVNVLRLNQDVENLEREHAAIHGN
jgi:potassium-transporting ATPase KdpC subunit